MNQNSEIYDLIVVGGGASGMMASGVAGEKGRKVLLIEKNKNLGEKLKITGGGRCNITNADYDLHAFLAHYGKAKDFLYSPFSQFGVKETFNFFEFRGLPLVVQARNRVFPKTEKAFDVFRVLEKYVRENKVKVLTGKPVTGIITKDKKIMAVRCGKEEYCARRFIFATGGLAHPETGSTGDGFKWLQKLGHTVLKPTPTIVPLSVKERWVKNLSGVSLSFMKITFFLDGKKQFSKTGKILFTHFGLSGPLILNLAGKVGDLLHSGVVTAKIDAYPDTDLGSLDKKITNILNLHKNKTMRKAMKNIAPNGMDGAILSLLNQNLSPEVKVHSITKEKRKEIARILNALPVTITGLMGYDRAVVADGGVPLTEVDTKTMRSKIIDNLYLTGDLLHINRPSGGYSLQLCWTSGFVAGSQS